MGTKKRVCMLASQLAMFNMRMFWKEALSLRRAGYDVTIIASTGEVSGERDGIKLLGFDANEPFRSSCGIIGSLRRFLKFVALAVKEDADVYHIGEPRMLRTACVVKLLQKVLRRREAFIIHDIYDFYSWEAFLDEKLGLRRKVGIALFTWLDAKLHRYVDFVIGAERPKLKRPASYGIPDQRMTIVENYVRTELFCPSPKPFDPDNFVVGYVGGMSFLRGIDKLARACALLGDRIGTKPALLLIGRFHRAEEEEQVLRFCEAHQASMKLKFVRWVPHEAVPEALRDVDVCCSLFYSKRYAKVLSDVAAPTKVYEYMACSKPVVATDEPAQRHTIESARCGILVDHGGAPRLSPMPSSSIT